MAPAGGAATESLERELRVLSAVTVTEERGSSMSSGASEAVAR